MNHKKNDQQIIHQELALDTYFSALLDDIPKEHSVEKKPPVTVDTNWMILRRKN